MNINVTATGVPQIERSYKTGLLEALESN